MPIVGSKIVAPINPWVVSKFIGMGSIGDIKRVCSSGEPYINKWSFRKPIKHSALHIETDADWFSVNDGFIINKYNSAPAALVGNFKGESWIYDPPRASDYGRILDFEGYDKSSTPFFTNRLIQTEIYKNQVVTMEFTNVYDIAWMVNNFKEFEAFRGVAFATLIQGFVVANNISASTRICSFYQLTGAQTIGELPMRLNWGAANSPGAGSWYILPIIMTGMANPHLTQGAWTTLSLDDRVGTWWPLPCSPSLLSVINEDWTPDKYVLVRMDSFNVTSPNAPSNVTSMTFTATNNNPTTPANVSVNIYVKPTMLNDYSLLGTISFGDIAANSSKTLAWNGNFYIESDYGIAKYNRTVIINGTNYYENNINLGALLDK
ncbi:MAG: hypothetical protein RRY36_08085 [Bacteroidaceae bacterium]